MYYSTEFKIKVVKEFLKGDVSKVFLQRKYNILGHSTIKNWVTKKLLWDVNKYQDEGIKEAKRLANEGKFTPYNLPSYGSQTHIMILTINPESEIYNTNCYGEFDFIYRIDIDDVK